MLTVGQDSTRIVVPTYILYDDASAVLTHGHQQNLFFSAMVSLSSEEPL